jgi:hypothetical protein
MQALCISAGGFRQWSPEIRVEKSAAGRGTRPPSVENGPAGFPAGPENDRKRVDVWELSTIPLGCIRRIASGKAHVPHSMGQ